MKKMGAIIGLLCGAVLSVGFGVACTDNETAKQPSANPTVVQTNAEIKHTTLSETTSNVTTGETNNTENGSVNDGANEVLSAESATAETQNTTSVSQISQLSDKTEFLVTGYYVGVADEGPNADKEILIKDKTTDDIIAVRNVPYGTELNYGYTYGDELAFYATVKTDFTVSTPHKRFLEFSADKNDCTDINSTVVSEDNPIEYALDNVTEITSWAEMKDAFRVGKIKEYSYIKISGNFFINEYLGAGNVTSYRLHMNENAKISANAKVDGSRFVSLRDSAMTANLGDGWQDNLFDDSLAESTKSIPGLNVKHNFYAVYTGATSAYFQLTLLTEEWVTAYQYTQAEMLTEVALAFARQEKQINYNQTSSTALRVETASPEDATAQRTLYLDCSSYANAVYYETFGEYILDDITVPIERSAGVWEEYTYEWENISPSTAAMRNYGRYVTQAIAAGKATANDYLDMVGFWQLRDQETGEAIAEYDTAAEQAALMSKVQGMLQVGDLVVYRHGSQNASTPCDTAGHVVLYLGNDTFYHVYSSGATGGSDYERNETNPQLSYDMNPVEATRNIIGSFASSELFTNTSSARYLFKSATSDTVGNFTLLRPLARGGFKATQKTLNRMKIAGLDMEKTSSVSPNKAVNPSDEITYTVTLKNTNSYDLNTVELTDVLPASTTYATNSATIGGTTATDGITVDGQNLTWKVTVAANATVTLSYTVRVSSAAVAGTVLESTQTAVSGVALNQIRHTVAGYTSTQLSDVATNATTNATNAATYSNPLEFAKTLYADVNANLFDGYTTVGAVLDDLIDETNLTC
ncbi:MAG: DUF11 domain-containing protein, partial [Clostridia bacterium]|nr:DUF11 domain-containing protein [Clostridia bacterium]